MKCSICQKDLASWEVFGPPHFPACQTDYWEYGTRLEEIEAIGAWEFTKQWEALQELVGLSQMPKELVRIIELETEIKVRKQEIEDLNEQIWHARNEINYALDEIRQLKKKASEAAVAA